MSNIGKNLQEEGLEQFDRYYGTYRGSVFNNADPDNLGRLQLYVPKVYGDEPYEEWSLPKGIYSGSGIGSFWIPAAGDQVWVTFENGDVRFPIWEYGSWRTGDVPKGASVDVKILQTNSGQRIEFNDTEKLIRITDSHKHVIELNKTGISFVSGAVSIGSLDVSAEPAVLGDTAVALLNEFITDIGNLEAIITSSGITSKISSSPKWPDLVSKWEEKWKKFNSKKVTLDR